MGKEKGKREKGKGKREREKRKGKKGKRGIGKKEKGKERREERKTLSIWGWLTREYPRSFPPGKMFTTPLGRPAATQISAKSMAERRVEGAGLMMTICCCCCWWWWWWWWWWLVWLGREGEGEGEGEGGITCVSHGKSGGELPGQHQKREVPGDDL